MALKKVRVSLMMRFSSDVSVLLGPIPIMTTHVTMISIAFRMTLRKAQVYRGSWWYVPSGHSVRLLPSNRTSILFTLVGLLNLNVKIPLKMAGGESDSTN